MAKAPRNLGDSPRCKLTESYVHRIRDLHLISGNRVSNRTQVQSCSLECATLETQQKTNPAGRVPAFTRVVRRSAVLKTTKLRFHDQIFPILAIGSPWMFLDELTLMDSAVVWMVFTIGLVMLSRLQHCRSVWAEYHNVTAVNFARYLTDHLRLTDRKGFSVNVQ